MAAIQTSYGHDMEANIAKTAGLRPRSGQQGRARSCSRPSCSRASISRRGRTRNGSRPPIRCASIPPCIALQKLAKELNVVIPISFFEKDGPRYYNSVAVADADGEILGIYRKSHIPDGPGYQEKYYFRPGDTGFKAWKTKHGRDRRRHLLGPMVPGSGARHGAGGRRALALPHGHRLRALRPHPRYPQAMAARHAGPCGVANAVPVVAANRVGAEENDGDEPDLLRPFLHGRSCWASSSRASARRRKAC